MSKFLNFYLKLLPIFSLVSIVLSTSRTVGLGNFNESYLMTITFFDLFVIFIGRKYIFNSTTFIVFTLIVFSLILGMIYYEPSRRFITDCTNPIFFFAKIYIFKKHWSRNDLSSYLKFYTRVAFIGSILLLPYVYYIFRSRGSSRLAIFPPMELPFSLHLVNGNIMFMILALLIIFFYGKRAILLGSFMTLLTFIIFVKRKHLLKYIFFLILILGIITQVFSIMSENLAVKRITYTFDLFNGNDDDKIEKISAGRSNEIEAILELMDPIDYIIGKGVGFKYYLWNKSELEEISNAHFSPLGFLSKYGILFTIFIYIFLFRILFLQNVKHLYNNTFLIALCSSIFIFFESFFAYTTFVAPIYPVLLGAVLHYKSKNSRELILEKK